MVLRAATDGRLRRAGARRDSALGLDEKIEHVTKRREVVQRKILRRLYVEVLAQLAEQLGLLDAVDAQVGFQVGAELDDLRRIARVLDDEVDQEALQFLRVELGRLRLDQYLAATQSVDGRPPLDRGGRVCSRFVLRMLETAVPPVDESLRQLSGPAMIVGSNAVGLALRRQVKSLGQKAVVVPIADDPSEVEEVIGSLPGVVEVKVYSGQTRQGLHYVKAAVVADRGIDVARIKAHCQEYLVYFKRPGRIILMDALPRSTRGKVLCERLP